MKKMDWCLVGEPSSTNKLGDIVKNGKPESVQEISYSTLCRFKISNVRAFNSSAVTSVE